MGRDRCGTVRALTDLLAPTPSDAEIAILGSSLDEGDGTVAEDRRVPEYRKGTSEKGLEVMWSAATDDLRNRMGEFAAEAFAGAQAAGQLPGQVNVRMQLRGGAAQDAPDITVRVQGWDGEILGEGSLRIVAPSGLLPRGEGRIMTSAPSDTELARQYGVYVDIAVSGLAPLNADGIGGRPRPGPPCGRAGAASQARGGRCARGRTLATVHPHVRGRG